MAWPRGLMSARSTVARPVDRGQTAELPIDASLHIPFRAWVRVVAFVLGLAAPAGAVAQTVDVYVFWRAGCPHCEREIEFLERLAAADQRVRVHRFEVIRNAADRRLLERAGEALRADVSAVPFTVIGDVVWVGYLDDATSGAEMKHRIETCLREPCPDSVAPLLAGGDETRRGGPAAADAQRLPAAVRLPLVGEVALRDLSLPALTVALGALDGFNPCAMWALVFLLGLLVGMRDWLRMWTLGVAFVVASAAVYFVFMAAWLNLLLFIGMVVWVRVGIGLVALAGAGYQLRQYVLARNEACPVTAPEARRGIFARLRGLAGKREFFLALAGIVALAFAVNLVELLCSAGIPVVYTQVLTMSGLPLWQYYAYVALYIGVFMLDDLVVLVLALATLHVSGLATTYTRYSHLLGGLLLAAIGAVLILRPEWLAFAA
jgi:hypothetical protein